MERTRRNPLFGGAWTVIRVRTSEAAPVAPSPKFAVALYGAPVTPAALLRLLGNPLQKQED